MDPGPNGGGWGTDALKREQPGLQGWSDCGLHCKSQRHGLGRAGVVSVGETPMVESKLKVNRSMFSQFLMERAQALTRKRAPPQPNIVTAAAQQGQTEAQSRDRGRGNAPGPQQRPSCEKKVLRRLQGAPELERGAVSFRGVGGREGDEGSSGAEPRGTLESDSLTTLKNFHIS